MATNTFAAMSAIDELHHYFAPKMQAAAPYANFSTLITFQPVTEAMVKNSNKRGGNVLGLERVVANGPALMWLVVLTVDTADHQSTTSSRSSIMGLRTWGFCTGCRGSMIPWVTSRI